MSDEKKTVLDEIRERIDRVYTQGFESARNRIERIENNIDYAKFEIQEQRIEMINKEIADLKRFQRLQQAFIDDSKYAIERLETMLAEFFEVTLNMEDLSQFHEKLREFIKKLGGENE